MSIKSVLFDADGVLIDGVKLHFEAFNQAIGDFGYIISKEEEDTYNAIPSRVKLKMLTETKGLPESLHDKIFEAKQKYTLDFIPKFLEKDNSKIELLASLRDMGINVALCSNTQRITLDAMVTHLGLGEHLDLIVSSQDVVFPKPNPHMWIFACGWFQTLPENACIVEDSPVGYESGVNAGIEHIVMVESPSIVNVGLIPRLIGE